MPSIEGDSTVATTPGVTGTDSSPQVVAGPFNRAGSGVYGESLNGFGVVGASSSPAINEITVNSADLILPYGVAGVLGAGGIGVQGIGNPGIYGLTFDNVGIFGICGNTDPGPSFNLLGTASGVIGYGITGDGVEGFSISPGGHGIFGKSQNWEGVHGETQSATAAGVAGFQLNPEGTGAGVYAENQGLGHGVFAKSQNWEGVHGETQSATAAGVAGFQLNPEGTGAGVYAENQGLGHGVFAKSQNWEGVHGETQSATAAGVAGFQLNPEGTGAGVYAESRGQGPAGFFNGDVLVTGHIFFPNGDCAEEFDVIASVEAEPGTVMVLNQDGILQPSQKAYDKKVVGVIAGAGDYKPGLILDKKECSKGRMPISLIGKAYCKVDAQYGAIEVGDLLTTSPKIGHAMKVDDPIKAFGTVIGKALRPHESGSGLIPILIALQ